MTKRDLLENVTFGHRVAEEEGDYLAEYFVKTEQWRRLTNGDVDIVYGAKGSGKSALYSLLTQEFENLRLQKRTVGIPAENPRGAPAFRDLVDDPPISEDDFRHLWKTYFLTLLADYVRLHLRTNNFQEPSVEPIFESLSEAGLLEVERSHNLKRILKSALNYVKQRKLSIENDISANGVTGEHSIKTRLSFSEPSGDERARGVFSDEDAFAALNTVLERYNITVWLMLDRLDVAFPENSVLEKNALRALFRTYLDLLAYKRLAIKIFLRTDIWNRLVEEGFREASHITRSLTITWDKKSLRNLIIRRVLFNSAVTYYYAVKPGDVLSDESEQNKLFYRVFPKQIEAGKRQTTTLDWMLSRIADGSQLPAPRELIHLLQVARDLQLKAYDLGASPAPEELLLSRQIIKESLPEVSDVRFKKTLCAEYPELKPFMMRLENRKAAHTVQSLCILFERSPEQTSVIAEKLVEAGFFLKKAEKGKTVFWVPFIYRDALNLSQGAAE